MRCHMYLTRFYAYHAHLVTFMRSHPSINTFYVLSYNHVLVSDMIWDIFSDIEHPNVCIRL